MILALDATPFDLDCVLSNRRAQLQSGNLNRELEKAYCAFQIVKETQSRGIATIKTRSDADNLANSQSSSSSLLSNPPPCTAVVISLEQSHKRRN